MNRAATNPRLTLLAAPSSQDPPSLAIWGEALGLWGYAGAALVLAGVLLTTRRARDDAGQRPAA